MWGIEGVVGEQLDVRRPATVRSTPNGQVRHVVVVLLLITTLGAGLWFLTPSNLGGSTTYLVTRGTSMLPTHEPGALVVTRTQDAYGVGDVIAFYREGLDRIVLHRIVGIDGDRFVTRGDNNAFDDAFHPAVADIVGTPWIHVPGGAGVMAGLRSPLTRGVVFGALAFFAVAAALQRRRSG
ncbi:MAG: signal peptidase I [Nocardioides sp.]